MSMPIYDLATATGRAGLAQRLEQLKQTASAGSDAAKVVAQIIDEVRRDGDEAVVRYMRQWTDAAFSAERIRVTEAELAAAERGLDPKMRQALTQAIEHVREYQEHIKPVDPLPIRLGGAELGLRFTPVDSVGLTVPGGTAVLFSSLIMLAVPAQVAGVPAEAISVVNPPPTRRGDEPAGSGGDISPLVLATCRLLGLTKVYRIGGAQAVAALAFGTQRVERVDLIAGPGNVYIQLAKQMLAGRVGSDNGFYGPSEIVTVADASADARKVAADLIAQAEHDPGKCFLVAWEKPVLDAILAEVARQRVGRRRLAAIDKALANDSAAVLVKDETEAAEVANR
jgi:histidinol dehydrogenase